MTSLLLFFLLQQGVNGNGDYEAVRRDHRIQAVKTTEKIIIDGSLSEPAWAATMAASGFIQSEPKEGIPATEDTEVKVLYDDENLYIGIFAHDSDTRKIIINDLKKDFEPMQGDYIEIVLDTFHDGRNGYMFATNPAGARRDTQMGNEGRDTNSSWDGIWFVKTRIVDSGWYAEISIPFKTLKFPSTDKQTWGFNVARNVRRKNEESFWTPIPRIYNLNRVSLAGTLEGLEGIRPGLNLKIKPSLVGSIADAGGDRNKDSDVTLDLKYGLTSGLAWDFTYNTDFSQVEADEQQINLTRFNLFFPEKRDFFLENAGIFTFGANEGRGPVGFNPQQLGGGAGTRGGTNGPGRQNAIQNDLLLFFSRTIGLSSDARAVPILGGTRLSGRAGRYELGFLNIQQRKQGTSPAANFTVGRVKRNVLANSDVGVMVINKDETGSHYNRVYGTDANFRFLGNIYANGFFVKTITPETKGKGDDVAARLSGAFKNRLWETRVMYTKIGNNFRDDVGFVPRTGIQKYATYTSLHLRPERLRRAVREFNVHQLVDYVIGPDGGLDQRFLDNHVRTQFQNGASIEIGTNPSLERLTQRFEINKRLGIKIPAGSYSYSERFISGNTDTSKKLSFTGRYSNGPFYTGTNVGYQAGATWRLGYKLNTSFNYSRNNIDLPQGKFNTNLLTTRFNYSFSTIMFLNALIQYNSDARQWTSNVRFNIIHRPLSDFFLVYNERRDSVTGNLLDRAIIGKFTYMIVR